MARLEDRLTHLTSGGTLPVLRLFVATTGTLSTTGFGRRRKRLASTWKGFGFHSFRREAITEFSALLGANAAQRLAGHATADMTLHYTLADREAQDAAIRQRQEAILGKDGGKLQ